MSNELISVIDLAKQYGKLKSSVFKVIDRLGIQPQKQRSSANAGQLISCVTIEESQRIAAELSTSSGDESNERLDDSVDPQSWDQGHFYLLSLEPAHDPGRFKVGFALSVQDRLRQLRCSAPFATVRRSWPCKRLWERTAIDCVTGGCEKLHTEVFRTTDIDAVISKCDSFFAMMPQLEKNADLHPREDEPVLRWAHQLH